MSDTEGGWSVWADREEGKIVKEPGDFKEGQGATRFLGVHGQRVNRACKRV